ncbi:MAG: response regulator [Dehalococcoidales bacterium]|jgi:CheY-like chemotaxis protein
MTGEREINILLVEDTKEHAVLMRRFLQKARLKSRLSWITDGKLALDFLHHRGAYTDRETNPRPDIILLDLKLPRVNGLEILEDIKRDERLKDIPVVILTASDNKNDIVNTYMGGAYSYFAKSLLFLNKEAGPTVILDTVMAMAGV